MKDDPRYQAWLSKMKVSTQEEKNNELALAVDNLGYVQVEALLDAGADGKTTNGIPFLAWAIRRTDDWRMTGLLLDRGVSANGVELKDLWAFFEEDREKAYKLLGRIVDSGMDIEERAKAAISALEKGEAGYVERVILRPGEDTVSLIDAGKAHDKEGVLQKIKPDTAAVESLYDSHFSGGVTADKLKEQVSAEGMTGFMLAVRAGKFDAVAAHYESMGAAPVVADVLQEDRYGQSVVTLMGHRQQLARLFTPALWHSRPDDVLVALEKVPVRYQAQLDKLRLVRDIAQLRLSKQAKARPSLPPKG